MSSEIQDIETEEVGSAGGRSFFGLWFLFAFQGGGLAAGMIWLALVGVYSDGLFGGLLFGVFATPLFMGLGALAAVPVAILPALLAVCLKWEGRPWLYSVTMMLVGAAGGSIEFFIFSRLDDPRWVAVAAACCILSTLTCALATLPAPSKAVR